MFQVSRVIRRVVTDSRPYLKRRTRTQCLDGVTDVFVLVPTRRLEAAVVRPVTYTVRTMVFSYYISAHTFQYSVPTTCTLTYLRCINAVDLL